MKYCPECASAYEDAFAACATCRVVLVDDPPLGARARAPVVVHRVPDAAAAALLAGMLEHHGIRTIIRSAMLPAYGSVRRDWGTSAWGEILAAAEDAPAARVLIADYLQALDRGGKVRDEDVEPAEDGDELP